MARHVELKDEYCHYLLDIIILPGQKSGLLFYIVMQKMDIVNFLVWLHQESLTHKIL